MIRALRTTVVAFLASSLFVSSSLAQSDAEGAMIGQRAWVRHGQLFVVSSLTPNPLDESRVQQQMEMGCENAAIRFGETAALRGFASADWSDMIRRHASAAGLVDDQAIAEAWLLEADEVDSSGHILSLRILGAAQLGDFTTARDLLSAQDPFEFPPQVAADLLFWSVLMDAETADAAAWETALLPRLEQAYRADNTSFAIRAWRVIGWLSAQPWANRSASCSALVADFGDRLLDLSEAGACPLLLGHLDMAIARHFGSRSSSEPVGGGMAWRQFATGLLALLLEETRTSEAMQTALLRPSSLGRCDGLMGRELARLSAQQ